MWNVKLKCKHASQDTTLTEIEDPVPELLELGSLQRFGLLVAIHLICWAVLNGHIFQIDLILDEKVFDVDVSGALTNALVSRVSNLMALSLSWRMTWEAL